MSALKQNQTFINATPAVTAGVVGNWHVDRARNIARHVSGLTVNWRPAKGGSRNSQPALDIGGLGKIKGTSWAAQIDRLVDEAIGLLEG